MATAAAIEASPASRNSMMMVVFAASLGTVFEWYDFYLYGSLATYIGAHFFTAVANPNARFVFSLLAFAAGFVVRPFGALIFGRLGDMSGRKHTFLITILIMGTSTFMVGMLPDYATIGVAAPIILVLLRLAQGLALGGEYGGAAIYVAEHAPDGKRGQYTSWIQTTATFGLFLSLLVIMVVQTTMQDATFAAFGWRVPFLVSIFLLAISVFIRLKLSESPVFQQMQREGRTSKAPLTESFAHPGNLRMVVIALFGLTAGEAVVWYGGQFYAQIFLTKTVLMAPLLANQLLAVALILGVPFFVVFGALSDRIGRKKIVLAGCLIAAVTYFPLFAGIMHYANPALEQAIARTPVTVQVHANECAVQFNPVGIAKFLTPCDVAKASLVTRGVPYSVGELTDGTGARIVFGDHRIESYDATAPDARAADAKFQAALGSALSEEGYPAKADPAEVNKPMVVLLLTLLVIYVTMVYGPMAAILVELFPARIRYSSMSLPYHIGNGWFGGLLPATVVAIVAATGDIYAGLWYPIVISGITVVVGALFLPETLGRPLDDLT